MASITAAMKKKGRLPQSNIKLSGSWTEKEHEAFKQGVLGMGWSNWKKIQELYVPTRTKDQVS
jgi:SHAQKYF class myb-like DNA-binding protein